ncbi:MAG: DUF554 domain-containing protein [Lachnospiraceae bacterium]|nr:DUF554 domain-containing protein [Lachnospiraceae bacterium]
MSLLGAIVNAAAIVAGAVVGILLKKGLSEKMADTLMKGLGLCTLFIGISGSLKGENTLVLILSMIIGTLIGEGVDLQLRLQKLGDGIQEKFSKGKTGESTLAEGFVTASLLFCVGAMAIVGSLQSGLVGDHSILYNKSILDFVAAIIYASTLGLGVALSAVAVFVYQGAITLLAGVLSPLLTDAVVNEMTCVGSVIIIGLALNMLGITKLKVMNYVPAIFVPIALCMFL